ncbi:MAG: M1 family metallopeptidase [Rhodothermales bacterium]
MRSAAFILLFIALLPAAACSQTSDSFDSGGPLMPEQAAYDVTYYELTLRVDDQKRTIDGSLRADVRYVEPRSVLVLDLVSDLDVHEVSVTDGTRLSWFRDGGKLWIDLGAEKSAGSTASVTVRYGGTPHVARRAPWDGGFTWAETPSGAPWIATTCQGEGADIWWPVKDHPSDEPDSMRMHITVRDPLVVAMNGRLENITRPEAGLATYNWFVSTPINTYNVALNIAPYEVLRDVHTSPSGETYPLEFYVLPEDVEKGRAFLPEINRHLSFYEELLGPYPFRADKYGVAQTPHLGMEHQSIIAYGANFDNGSMTGGKDWGFDALHHHELAHEWWGNLVTNADWKDMWIHEGFGTYMQALYSEKLFGMEAYHEYMDAQRRGVRNRLAIGPRESQTADQIYRADIYAKGAYVLHTLRYLIGDEAMMTALRRMAYPDPEMEKVTDGSQCRFVSTDDFIKIAEKYSGMKLGWFFDVYVRQPALPELVQERAGDELRLKWKAPDGLPFTMPIDVRVGAETIRVPMDGGSGSIAVPEGVEIAVDPDRWVLRQ